MLSWWLAHIIIRQPDHSSPRVMLHDPCGCFCVSWGADACQHASISGYCWPAVACSRSCAWEHPIHDSAHIDDKWMHPTWAEGFKCVCAGVRLQLLPDSAGSAADKCWHAADMAASTPADGVYLQQCQKQVTSQAVHAVHDSLGTSAYDIAHFEHQWAQKPAASAAPLLNFVPVSTTAFACRRLQYTASCQTAAVVDILPRRLAFPSLCPHPPANILAYECNALGNHSLTAAQYHRHQAQ